MTKRTTKPEPTAAETYAARRNDIARLYAAIIREIAAKGTAARFKKHERGVFVAPPRGKGA